MSTTNTTIEKPTSLPLYKTEIFGLVILSGLVLYLALFALKCQVHFYDSFEYLNNAKEWIGVHTRYDINRPPALPMFLVPIAFLSKFLNSPSFFERFPYFMGLFFGISSVLMFWRLSRQSLLPEYSMLAAIGLAFNALFLHYWIFPMPEILACFLLFIYWHFVLKRNYLLAGILLGTILSLRYQLAPLGILGIIYSVVAEKDHWSKVVKNWTIVALVSAIVLILFHYVSVSIGAGVNLVQAYFEVSERLTVQFFGTKENRSHDPIFALFAREFAYLFHFVTSPVLLLSFIGMCKALYRKDKIDWLFFIWFWGIFLVYTLVVKVTWKEARYLIVILPPIYYFFSMGFILIWEYIENILKTHHFTLRKILPIFFSIALLIAPFISTTKELKRFNDKAYTRPVGRTLANIIKPNLKADESVFWIGEYYTIAPFNYYFSIPEKFFFFNLFSNGLSFYLERPCLFNYTEEFIYKGAVGSYAVLNRNVCQDCGFINNFDPLKPLTVHKVESQTKYYKTNKTVFRTSGKVSTTFTIFASESGDELYVSEVEKNLLIDKGEAKPNTVIQFILEGERLPIYPEPSFFGLPSQAPLTQRQKLAKIHFIMVSELSESIGRAF
jgi:hypothetical protein